MNINVIRDFELSSRITRLGDKIGMCHQNWSHLMPIYGNFENVAS